MMGTGIAEGEDRAVEAARRAISSPLLEGASVNGARGVIINVTGGPDLSLVEVSDASTIVQEAAHEDANIIFGAVVDPELKGKVKITVIATGFGGTAQTRPAAIDGANTGRHDAVRRRGPRARGRAADSGHSRRWPLRGCRLPAARCSICRCRPPRARLPPVRWATRGAPTSRPISKPPCRRSISPHSCGGRRTDGDADPERVGLVSSCGRPVRVAAALPNSGVSRPVQGRRSPADSRW